MLISRRCINQARNHPFAVEPRDVNERCECKSRALQLPCVVSKMCETPWLHCQPLDACHVPENLVHRDAPADAFLYHLNQGWLNFGPFLCFKWPIIKFKDKMECVPQSEKFGHPWFKMFWNLVCLLSTSFTQTQCQCTKVWKSQENHNVIRLLLLLLLSFTGSLVY